VLSQPIFGDFRKSERIGRVIYKTVVDFTARKDKRHQEEENENISEDNP